MKYRIALAGSSKNTVLMAETLAIDPRFEVVLTLSPEPKLVGREQISTKNPLHLWSEEKQIKHLLIKQKIEKTLQAEIMECGEIDFLLVVDFGYFIPSWLLGWPKIAPLNIHPSLLPKWRGSSPGQFCLLFQNLDTDGKKSAVTLMVMNEKLDQGPIINQLQFEVLSDWTQVEYYAHAFDLMSQHLAELIAAFATGKIQSQKQSLSSPTIIARRLSKDDSFVAWDKVSQIMSGAETSKADLLPNIFKENSINLDKIKSAQLLVDACHAFSPWPGLWTLVKTNKGEKRMKILSCHLETNSLILDQVQIEGKNPCAFSECKNSLV